MQDLGNFTKRALPTMAVTFVATTIKNLVAKDTIRSAIRGQVRKIVTGNREKPFQDIPTVEKYTDQIMDLFDRKHIFPVTIGIDGPPGSGKSTLGRSLAKRTGLEWTSLYAKDMGAPYFFLTDRIYENIRLFRTQDIDRFDVIIYIDCPAEDAQRRVIDRDRNGALADYVDFTMLKKIGDAAFGMADGDEIVVPNSPVRIKIRPKEGFGVMDNLRTALQSKGVNARQLSKEEQLFTYCYGKAKSGMLPYVKFGAYKSEILSGAKAALRVATGKKLLS